MHITARKHEKTSRDFSIIFESMLPSFPLAKEKGEKGMRRSGASTFKRNDVRLAKQDQNIIKKTPPTSAPHPFPHQDLNSVLLQRSATFLQT